MVIVPPDPDDQDDLTDAGTGRPGRDGPLPATGTPATQASSPPGPQTVGYGLVDSPAGQCAWIVEKFWSWTDCDGDPVNVLGRDEMLDNVMLYWLPGDRRVLGPPVLGELQPAARRTR